jgi:hypothetical protein
LEKQYSWTWKQHQRYETYFHEALEMTIKVISSIKTKVYKHVLFETSLTTIFSAKYNLRTCMTAFTLNSLMYDLQQLLHGILNVKQALQAFSATNGR